MNTYFARLYYCSSHSRYLPKTKYIDPLRAKPVSFIQELADNGELEQMLPKAEDLNTRYIIYLLLKTILNIFLCFP